MKNLIKDSYDMVGEYYYEMRKHGTGGAQFYNEYLEMPTTLKLLGKVKNKKILDLGCGPGLYARKLTESGAKVKGIDNSKVLVNIAKKEAPKAEITLGDAEKLPYKNKEFDIVLASLILGHLASWDKVLKEVRRVLKKDGILIFSVHNPVTESLVSQKWFFKKVKTVKDYFQEKWRIIGWKMKDGRVMKAAHHHKTYGTIIRNIVKNKFEILDYQDARPLTSAKKKFPEQYKRTKNMPHFCVWKVKKK